MAERREKLLGDVGGRDARRDVYTLFFIVVIIGFFGRQERHRRQGHRKEDCALHSVAERREKLLGDVGRRDARRDVYTVIFVADKRDTDHKDTEKKILRFTVWLKEERNCWGMLVEEMHTGMFILSFL